MAESPLPDAGGLRGAAHDPQGNIRKCPQSPALSYSVVYMTIIVVEGILHRNSKTLLCPEALNSQDESRVITLLRRRRYRRFKWFAQGDRWRMRQRPICTLSLKIHLKKLSSNPSWRPAFSARLVACQHIWVVFGMEEDTTQEHKIRCSLDRRPLPGHGLRWAWKESCSWKQKRWFCSPQSWFVLKVCGFRAIVSFPFHLPVLHSEGNTI